MAQTVIPSSIPTPLQGAEGDYKVLYSKPAGSEIATVFVASSAQSAKINAISKSAASASLVNGVLHLNLGASAAARSAAGLASETSTITRELSIG
jgi:hypothetical protein